MVFFNGGNLAKVGFSAKRVSEFKCPENKSQAFLWDVATFGLGLRTTPNGDPAYIFQSRYAGRDIRITIGKPHSWSIPEAQKQAREYQRLIDIGQDPRKVKRERIANHIESASVAKEAREFTLKHLLSDYIVHLKKLERDSWNDAQSIFRLHIEEAFPKIIGLPANQVTGEHIADMMRRLVEAGKARTANKLRSYVRAAYAIARSAKANPSIALRFKGYRITANPADDSTPDSAANIPDKRPLSLDEMRAYWSLIKDVPGFNAAVLRLHLLTGGQRIKQLASLKTCDVHKDQILIFDKKGKPGKAARPHLVPLIPAASEAMQLIKSDGEYAISTDGGKTHVSATTLSNWAKDAAVGIEDFTAKRIRSGIETLLASQRVGSDIRGRLQSHGISGVQARHYDDHDYMDEKREAVQIVYDLLEGSGSSNNSGNAKRGSRAK